MSIAIFFGAVTILLFFVLGIVTARYSADKTLSPAVSDRFLERSVPYNTDDIRNWIKNNPEAAKGYAFPVLFPFDLIFMIFLGGFLGMGSILTADTIDWLKPFSWLFMVMPVVYVLADLIEDILLAHMLRNMESICDTMVSKTRMVTNIKLITCTISIFQTVIISGLSTISG